MVLFGKSKGKRIHTRTIELNTYEYDDQRLVIEGSLTEKRLYEYHLATGEKKPAGIIHHMIIRWLVNMSTFIIEDIEVEMPAIPHKECLETITSLAPIKGMRIAGGFTLKAKELVGGVRGCSHLMALLISMAPAAVQGYATYHSQKPAGFGPLMTEVLQFLVNSCRPWREGGPLIKKYMK
ncbi:MAG: DUF2889 domain-containing protein [Deltaproteobacteria bacterium]|nr:DUF2889 domain-containing protein [Deltaproteobacteria bacterium]